MWSCFFSLKKKKIQLYGGIIDKSNYKIIKVYIVVIWYTYTLYCFFVFIYYKTEEA